MTVNTGDEVSGGAAWPGPHRHLFPHPVPSRLPSWSP